MEEKGNLQLHESIKVENIHPSTRLDQYLGNRMRNKSRNMIQRKIKEQKVWVNGKPSRSNYKVKPGDLIEWYESYGKMNDITPLAVELDVVYETDELIVINKKAGMPMHPGLGNYDNTLVNALKYYYEQKGEHDNLVKDCLVHRIDKNTSGIVVVPKTKEAFHALEIQFQQKTTERVYLAIVWGIPIQHVATLRHFMGRNPLNQRSIEISEDRRFGKLGVTHYELVEHHKKYSLVRCVLETGRTHQIRLHMKHIGHPLVGDSRYFIKRPDFDNSILERHALHAHMLGFEEPSTGLWKVFSTPIPEDMQGLLNLSE
ncbi:RluA family pseudouridine synthase [Algivirga pacifica]|uniref:Pseudouridine synthase n=1 Tax=Algivirga pacifica TaxID=1162670 RepID=A0ABP9D1R1_9BACT